MSYEILFIDGMEGDLNSINPQDIESISVLKDASGATTSGAGTAVSGTVASGVGAAFDATTSGSGATASGLGVYLNSSGFDPSFFHDDDGTSWLVNMREGFTGILIQQFNTDTKTLTGPVYNVYAGTNAGYTEGPHVYKKNGWYYLLHPVALDRRVLQGRDNDRPGHPGPGLGPDRSGDLGLRASETGAQVFRNYSGSLHAWR